MPSGPIQSYFKVLVGVFDVERKCHGVHGTPNLFYITYSLSFLAMSDNTLNGAKDYIDINR